MNNKMYLNSFIDALKVLSVGTLDNYKEEFTVGLPLDPEIFKEVIRNGVMAIRDGSHFFLRDIKKVRIRDMPNELHEIPDLFTISYKADVFNDELVKEDVEAHTLVVRRLSDLAYSVVLWASQDLEVWQPIPIYNVVNFDADFNVEDGALPYSYWAHECFLNGQGDMMIRQLPFEKLNEDQVEYLNQTYLFPILFELFLGFWNKYPRLSFKDQVLRNRTLVHDEEGDVFSLDWIKYKEIV